MTTTPMPTLIIRTFRPALILALILLLAPLLALADGGRDIQAALLMDFDSATPTYCNVVGPISTAGKIQTSGSSTSVTETVAGSNPFTPLTVNDVLAVRTNPASPLQTDLRYIITRTDAANVVIGAAATWTGGYVFSWYDQVCGTSATIGWMDVSGLVDYTISVTIAQMNAASVGWRIECRAASPGAGINIVYPKTTSDCGDGTYAAGYCEFTAAATHQVVGREKQGQCRVATTVTADDGGDTGTDREQVTISMSGRIRQ